MNAMKTTVWAATLLLALTANGCGPMEGAEAELGELPAAEGKADASLEATVLDFDFDGEVVAQGVSSYVNSDSIVRDQFLFTIGHLNGNRSVGRLDALTLSNVRTSAVAGGTRITYHAKFPVAWGSKTGLPTSYTFTLPRNVGFSANKAFTAAYKATCTEVGAHDVDEDSIWYYYRPLRSGCVLAAADVVTAVARVTVSPANTTGKYPEYDKVWEDGVLRVVSIFGKYQDGATTASDAGVQAFNTFVAAVRAELAGKNLVTVPTVVPTAPGVQSPDVELTADLGNGRKIQVNALLVDNISTATPAFYARYEALSTRADLIAYNGHAGLGQNVRALAGKGRWTAGQYVIVFMNGCDTFAYVDGSLAQARARLNTDDPTGTKYLDFVVNGMPAFFRSDSAATMAMIRGLLNVASPQTYEQIFKNIDSAQVVLVTGEQDNVFQPTTPSAQWPGLSDVATLARGARKTWKTETLPAGRYLVELSGTGDADLYVRKGTAPTTRTYDCRPNKSSSNEQCLMTLTSPTTLNILVVGDTAASQIRLRATAQ